MPDATVKIEGSKEVINFFNQLAQGGYMRRPLGEYGRSVVKATAPYPSPPSGSRYRRTGTLGRQWAVQEGEKSVIIANRTKYAGWVQMSPTQAWFHKTTGWKNVDIEATAPPLVRALMQSVIKEIDKLAVKAK